MRQPPYGGLAHLDDFIAARDVAFRTVVRRERSGRPRLPADLDEVLASVGRSLDALLGD